MLYFISNSLNIKRLIQKWYFDLSTSGVGGAGKAVYRLHRNLFAYGV